MNEGKRFEADISGSISEHVFWQRINDNAASFSGASALRFSPKNGYDFEAYVYPNLFALELKSTKNTSISFERKGVKSQAMIKWYQINALQLAGQHRGIVAGFIFNWRNKNKTHFVRIEDFIKFMDSTDKKSINQTDILSMPHILIEQKLKRTRYSYDMEKFFMDCAMSD